MIMVHPGRIYALLLNRRISRKIMVSKAGIKHSRDRPDVELRYAFEDEFPHLAWEPDGGLVHTSASESPLYKLTNHKHEEGVGIACVYEYKMRYALSVSQARPLNNSFNRRERDTALVVRSPTRAVNSNGASIDAACLLSSLGPYTR